MRRPLGWLRQPLWPIVILALVAVPYQLEAIPHGDWHSEELVVQALEDDALLVRPHRHCRRQGSATRLRILRLRLLVAAVHPIHLQAHFEFTSSTPLHSRHTLTFPPALLGLAARHGAAHVELALTRGRWVGPCPAFLSFPQPVACDTLMLHVFVCVYVSLAELTR